MYGFAFKYKLAFKYNGKDATNDSWQLEFKHLPKVDVQINIKWSLNFFRLFFSQLLLTSWYLQLQRSSSFFYFSGSSVHIWLFHIFTVIQ